MLVVAVVSSLVCNHLGYLRTDFSGIEQASFFHLILISLPFTLISFTDILPGLLEYEPQLPAYNFILFDL